MAYRVVPQLTDLQILPYTTASRDQIESDFRDCFTSREPLEYLEKTTYCTIQEFNSSNPAYETKRFTPGWEWPPKVEKIGEVRFLLSSESFPQPEDHRYHLAYYATLEFLEGPPVSFEFHFNSDRHPGIGDGEIPRYEVTLTNFENDRPIAGIIYDRDARHLYYLVIRWV